MLTTDNPWQVLLEVHDGIGPFCLQNLPDPLEIVTSHDAI